MKTLLLLVLAGSAIGFGLPTFAQQTNTPDPQLRQCLMRSPKKLTRPTTTAMPPPWPHSTRRTLFW